MHQGVTSKLARATQGVAYSQLPPSAIEIVKLSLIDSIGCMLAGGVTRRAEIALDLAEEFGGRPVCTVVGHGRTSAPQAAFVNSELLNALDYDYIGPISSHIAPYVVTPCLALAERQRVSGQQLILALALAHEIGGRAVSAFSQHKIAIDQPPWFKEHPRFTYASAVFGAVAGAATLMALDLEQLENAFGIAGASSPVPATMKWQHMAGPAIMTKYNAWTGWTAQLATLAVLAASKGFTGDRSFLDGEYGYWKILGSADFDADKLLQGLGEQWHLHDIRFKLYPTCYIYHAGIQGVHKLVTEHGLVPDEITEIVVHGDQLMQTPNRMGVEVRTFADAQFFIRFNFALAALHGGQPSPAWQTPAIYEDPRIQALTQKVRIATHPDFEAYVRSAIESRVVPILWKSRIDIHTTRGVFSCEEAPRMQSPDPLDDKPDLLAKFWHNAEYAALDKPGLARALDDLCRLEQLDDVQPLLRSLARPSA